jgi:hypothetical protein
MTAITPRQPESFTSAEKPKKVSAPAVYFRFYSLVVIEYQPNDDTVAFG